MILEDMELVEIDIDQNGNVLPPKNDKLIVIDADTIAYQVCITFEEEYPIFPWEDIEELKERYSVDEENNTYYDIDIESVTQYAIDKVKIILDSVGGKPENTELHFTGRRNSFRYDLLKEAFPDEASRQYKAKRKTKRSPSGLTAVKLEMLKFYKGEIHYEYESDDVVEMKKRVDPNNVILVALDKDVWANIPGKHWNYYENKRYGKKPHWVTISKDEANYNQYKQVITGDKSDNVPGLYGIGDKKAAKYIQIGMTEEELWDGVLEAYEDYCDYGDPEEMALLNMRLVNMRQLEENMKIRLWTPEFDENGDHKYLKIKEEKWQLGTH